MNQTPEQRLQDLIDTLLSIRHLWPEVATRAGVTVHFIVQLCNGRVKNPGFMNTVAVENAISDMVGDSLKQINDRWSRIRTLANELAQELNK